MACGGAHYLGSTAPVAFSWGAALFYLGRLIRRVPAPLSGFTNPGVGLSWRCGASLCQHLATPSPRLPKLAAGYLPSRGYCTTHNLGTCFEPKLPTLNRATKPPLVQEINKVHQCACVFVCVRTCACVCLHICMHVGLRVDVCMCLACVFFLCFNVLMYVCLCIFKCMHVCMFASLCMCVFPDARAYCSWQFVLF